MNETSSVRRPYRGSCHCGATTYVVFLTLPHPTTPGQQLPTDSRKSLQKFYRCNCTTCQKTGFFHMRVPWAPEDFFLLSPSDPLVELGNYQCFDKVLNWLFCKTCGVRTIIFSGEGEQAEVDLSELGVKGKNGESLGKTTVWRPKSEAWGECRGLGSYLSVNGFTVDAGQEGFDLRELTEKKAIEYLDCLELNGPEEEPQRDRPFEHGAY